MNITLKSSAPKSQVILGSMLLTMGLAGMCSILLVSRGEIVPTMNTDWSNATREYMRFQKMNPIFGEQQSLYLITKLQH